MTVRNRFAVIVNTCGFAVVAMGIAFDCNAQDSDVMSKILSAWQQRRDANPALMAEWTISGVENISPNAPPDPEASPTKVLLKLQGDLRRIESRRRYYDVDGGPRGSMSWQTGIRIVTFSPQGGWRRLTQTSLPGALASGEIGPPPNLLSGCLSRNEILDVWYRGRADVQTLGGTTPWSLCSDKRFATEEAQYVTIMAVDSVSRLFLMDLDRSLGFLPIRARLGKLPPEGEPLNDYQELVVEVDRTASTANRPIPIIWQSLEMSHGQPESSPTIMTLTSLVWESPEQPAHYEVEFPDTAVVAGKSAIRAGNASDFTGESRITPSRPLHSGYWLAIGFGLLLLIMVSWRLLQRSG